jgi:membrane-associated protease RseP (regulator of RpoE activity)
MCAIAAVCLVLVGWFPVAQAPAGQKPDQLLADAIVQQADAVSFIFELATINTIDKSYEKREDDRAAREFNRIGATIKSLASAKFEDAKKEAARKDLIASLKAVQAQIGVMGSAITQARMADSWEGRPRGMAERAYKESLQLPTDGSVATLVRDPAFQALLPPLYLELSGLVTREGNFTLGMYTHVRSSLFVIDVAPGSLAEKLKLTKLETIVSVNGIAPKDVTDFKQMLRKARGQTVRIRVKPLYAAAREYDVSVPSDLAQTSVFASPPAPRPTDVAAGLRADKALAKSVVDLTDAIATVELLRLASQVESSFKRGVDGRGEKMGFALAADRDDLKKATYADPMKDAARNELVTLFEHLMTMLSRIVGGFEAAAKAGGWTKEAGDLLNAGVSHVDKLPFDGSVDKLVKDPDFQKLLPSFYLRSTGLIPDPVGLSLGARVFISNTLLFLSVTPEGLAAKLGFRGLDEVTSFDGKRPADVDDLKQMIKASVGKRVSITVQPLFGDLRQYTVIVPK